MKRQAGKITCLTIIITLVLYTLSPAMRYNFMAIDYPDVDCLTLHMEIIHNGLSPGGYMITVDEEDGLICESGNFTIFDYLGSHTASPEIKHSGQFTEEDEARFDFFESDITFTTSEYSERVLKTGDTVAKPWIDRVSALEKANNAIGKTESATIPPPPADVLTATKDPQPETERQLAATPTEMPISSEIESNPERTIHRERWLLAQDASSFTIQIRGFYNEAFLLRFIRKNQAVMQNEIAYSQSNFNGKTWYQLFYGLYPTKNEAQHAIDHLPPSFRKQKPWIRGLSSVQKVIRDR
jgi:SPOR domain